MTTLNDDPARSPQPPPVADWGEKLQTFVRTSTVFVLLAAMIIGFSTVDRRRRGVQRDGGQLRDGRLGSGRGAHRAARARLRRAGRLGERVPGRQAEGARSAGHAVGHVPAHRSAADSDRRSLHLRRPDPAGWINGERRLRSCVLAHRPLDVVWRGAGLGRHHAARRRRPVCADRTHPHRSIAIRHRRQRGRRAAGRRFRRASEDARLRAFGYARVARRHHHCRACRAWRRLLGRFAADGFGRSAASSLPRVSGVATSPRARRC